MTVHVIKSPRDYRSLGVMFDQDDFERQLVVGLWWRDLSVSWRKRR